MHTDSTCDQNILCCPREMNIFTNCYWKDGRTYVVIIVQFLGSCNINTFDHEIKEDFTLRLYKR